MPAFRSATSNMYYADPVVITKPSGTAYKRVDYGRG